MNTAAKGRRAEHKTRNLLEAEGYSVIRAAASKGVFDLCAYNKAHIRFVQSKCNGWAGALELEAMQLEQVPPNATKEIWRWDDYARAPRVRLV